MPHDGAVSRPNKGQYIVSVSFECPEYDNLSVRDL